MIIKTHHFFIVELRSFPILISINSFNLLSSLLNFFKETSYLNFTFSLINCSFCMFFWWICYTKEASIEGKSSIYLDEGLKISIILFISSEIFFFFSFFWSYFHYFLAPIFEVGIIWPLEGLKIFEYNEVPLLNTLILLRSGMILTCSHYFLITNFKWACSFSLILTSFLGLIFSLLQSAEYSSSFFRINDGSFGTVFFLLTGFHGLHVIIGTMFLLTTWFKINLSQLNYIEDIIFELSSWYWHFVDVVWLFLFFFLYYGNN